MNILNSKIAYLMGNFMADGSFYYSGRNYRFEFVDGSPYKTELRYSLQHILFIKKILEDFLKKPLPPIRKIDNKYRLSFRNNNLANIFLKTFKIKAGDKSRIIDIPVAYKNSKYALNFWQGYLDGDGSIARKSRRIAVESMSQDIISSFADYLTKNNIYFSNYMSKRGKEYSHVILIRSVSFRDFANKIGFCHPLKTKLLKEKLKDPDFYKVNNLDLGDSLNKLIDYTKIFDDTIFLVNGNKIVKSYGVKVPYNRTNIPLQEIISLMKTKKYSNEQMLKKINKYRFKKSKGSTNSVKLPLILTEEILKIAKFARIRGGGISFSKRYIESFGENYFKILNLFKITFDINPKFTCKNEPIFCSGVLKDFFSHLFIK